MHFLLCCQVLSLDKGNVKAMYRQAQASCGMKDYEAAKNTLIEAQKLDPENKGT